MKLPINIKSSKNTKSSVKPSKAVSVRPYSVPADKISIEKANNSISLFRSQISDIQRAIDSGQNMESTSYQLSAELLKAVVQSIPNYEEKLKEGSGRDVYAFAALIDSSLKLTNEMRALQDRSAMAKLIMSNIVKPQLEMMARRISTDINKSLMELDKKHDIVAVNALNSVKDNSIDFIGTVFSEIGTALQQYFGGQSQQETLDV